MIKTQSLRLTILHAFLLVAILLIVSVNFVGIFTMAFSAASASSASALSTAATREATTTTTTEADGVIFTERYITLPTTGVTAQIICSRPSPNSIPKTTKTTASKPPLVFLHGSFHGAWCWQEHWAPYFSKQGYRCISMSWRGTGGTPPIEENVKKIKILEHCNDLRGLLEILPTILVDEDGVDDKTKKEKALIKPILVSHSMGGIYVMKYLEEEFLNSKDNKNSPTKLKLSDMFSGIATFCSTPPSGNGPSTFRVLRRSLRDAYRITVGFVAKKVNTDSSICRQCFFGGEVVRDDDGNIINDHGVSDDDVARYQEHFTKDSKIVLDVSDLSRRLPSKLVDGNGRAPFTSDLPPCLVVGAKEDFIVDGVGNQETASYYGLEEPIFVDSPHDVMLGKNWKKGADVLKEWIEQAVQ